MKPTKKSTKITKELTTPFAAVDALRFELNEFQLKHAGIINKYEELKTSYEVAIKDAAEVFKMNQHLFGPRYHGFSLTSKRQIDADLLVTIMPEMLVAVGYKMSTTVFDGLVAAGSIPVEVEEQVVQVNIGVKTPK